MTEQPGEIVPTDHDFLVPVKLVKSPDDMVLWENSIGYHEYIGFVLAINEAVKGKSLKIDQEDIPPVISNLEDTLDKLDDLIKDTPPVDQPQRFGNQAFRTWLDKVKAKAFEYLADILPETLHRGIPEILTYFLESFGNQIRIDYGTGHEIAFVMFLCCLFKIGAVEQEHRVLIGTHIFNRYLRLVRKLQQTYRMEPAGSHGVWSLDDYQFIPFIWGSSQLIGHQKLEPCTFLNPQVVETFFEEYMFLGCIKYINHVKSGPFAEHSNQLWGISGVSNWGKVNKGLVKMYKAEVLGKFPVAQHIFFGSLLPMTPFIKNKETGKSTGFMGMTRPKPQ